MVLSRLLLNACLRRAQVHDDIDTLTAFKRKILATGGELVSGVATHECQNPFMRLACPAMCDERDGVSVRQRQGVLARNLLVRL